MPAKPSAKGSASARGKSPKARRAAEDRQAEQFSKAVGQFQAGEFGKARRILEAVANGPDVGLAHRAKVYLDICKKRQAPKRRPALKTVDDYYNYIVGLVNDGRLEDALITAKRGLDRHPGAAHLHYIRAVAFALLENWGLALSELEQAVSLDPEIRSLASRDPDLAYARRFESFAKLIAGG